MADVLTRLLHRFNPETAHHLAIRGLTLLPAGRVPASPAGLAVRAFGLNFPNPLGLAAGFDKNAEAIGPLFRLGFGFVEAGGVTPRPQKGNPRPRVFRLNADQAVINRYGLNSEGVEAVAAHLERRDRSRGLIGINLGPNKDSADRVLDFKTLTERLAPLTDYLSVNISSPNTPGLRDLQEAASLKTLMLAVLESADRVAVNGRRTPVLFKIAPDLDDAALDAILDTAAACKVDGLIIANTTLARPASLTSPAAMIAEAGGLSGPPVFAASTRMLAKAYLRIGSEMPLIGVGGISSARDALTKIEAGASLIQLYTGLIFQGPKLVRNILAFLAQAAAERPLSERVGARAGEIASGSPV